MSKWRQNENERYRLTVVWYYYDLEPEFEISIKDFREQTLSVHLPGSHVAVSFTGNFVTIFLNWLVFDRNYGFITDDFKQITTAARETGTDIAHEKLQMPAAITITQPGYVYIYLSNKNSTPVEVFFDEFKVTHTKSPVIQTDDYYPPVFAGVLHRQLRRSYLTSLSPSGVSRFGDSAVKGRTWSPGAETPP